MPATVDIFRRYLHRVFVETGTHDGAGVQTALAAGYEEVWSIEAGKNLYEACVGMFADDPRVHLVLGKSEVELGRVLGQFQEPVTVWLDAHSSFGQMLPGTNLMPLKDEIWALSSAPVREHTILVDDIRLLSTFNTSLDEIKSILYRVNPNYRLELIDGNHFRSDVLVATIPS